jgi:hypothetical protein
MISWQREFDRRRGFPVDRHRPALSDRPFIERNMLGPSKQMPVTANVHNRLAAPLLVERLQQGAEPARAMFLLPERSSLEAAVRDRRRILHL